MFVPIPHLSELPSVSFGLSKIGEQHGRDLQDLVPILPRFFVPPLEDKPQNPIMENLRLEEANLRVLKAPRRKVVDRRDDTKEKVVKVDDSSAAKGVETIWREAAEMKRGVTVRRLRFKGIVLQFKTNYLELSAFLGQTTSYPPIQSISYRISLRTK